MKSLAQTNRYLADRIKAKKLINRNIASSTAIETGEPISEVEKKLNNPQLVTNSVTLA